VPNVIFPTGAVMDVKCENIILYSGASDTYVTATELSIEDIMNKMEKI